jgi:hypothetical protein
VRTRTLPTLVKMNRATSAVTSLAAATGRRNMSLSSTVYRKVYKRNTLYLSYILAGAILGEAVYHSTMDGIWTSWNKGVRS